MMDKLPSVSVVVPVYNASAFIEKCAVSLMAQTYADLQLVFVDDCSSDDGIEKLQRVIEAHPGRECNVVRLKQNGGSANARLVGLKSAGGQYVIMVDSDDYVAHDFVERLAVQAQLSDADIVMCDFCYVSPGGSRVPRQAEFDGPEDCMAKVITGQIHSSLCNKLIRKSLYDDHEIYPTPGLNFYDDKSVMYRLMYFAKTIEYVHSPLYYYNIANGQSQTHGNYSVKIDSAFRLLGQMDEFYRAHKVDSVALTEALNQFKCLVYGTALLYATDDELAHYKNSFQHIPTRQMFGYSLPIHFKAALALQNTSLPLRLYRQCYRMIHNAIGRLKS